MLISREDVIAGMPSVRARDLMRAIRDSAVSLGGLAGFLIEPDEQAPDVVRCLAEEGYLCRVEPEERGRFFYDVGEIPPGGTFEDLDYWGTTVAGNALAKARIGKPMSRQKAVKIVDDFIDRVKTINSDPDSLFAVHRVELFGSYANPDRHEVGDVDARVLLERRVDGDEFMRRAADIAAAAEAKGRHFRDPVERLSFAELELQRFLRGRSTRLDIQFDAVGHERPLPDGALMEVIYRRVPQ